MGDQLRFFISSTFEGLTNERRYLARTAFPKLRQAYSSQGISIIDVDLRWGVTAEESKFGQTLGLCLDEVANCLPFVVILLGERYGWRPEINSAVLERHPSIKDYAGRSITELEIRRALAGTSETSSNDILCYDFSPSTAAHDEDSIALADLKADLRADGRVKYIELQSSTEFEERIEADLREVVDAYLAKSRKHKDDELVALGLAQAKHDSPGYALMDDWSVETLLHFSETEARCAMIVSEEGGGRTAALLALADALDEYGWNILTEATAGEFDWKNANVAIPLFLTHSDLTSDFAEAIAATIALLGRCNLGATAAIDPRSATNFVVLLTWLAEMLEGLGAKRILLLLDDFDAYTDPLIADKLDSTLRFLPESAGLVLSCRNDRLGALAPKERISLTKQISIHQVDTLVTVHVEKAIVHALADYGKRLDEALIDQIVAAPSSDNPRHLFVIIEELRTGAIFGSLQSDISALTEPPNLQALYATVLERHRSSADETFRESFDLAVAALVFSWEGLAEPDWRDITASSKENLPAPTWSRIFVALAPMLSAKRGKLRPIDGSALTAMKLHIEERVDAAFVRQLIAAQAMRRPDLSRPRIEALYQVTRLQDLTLIESLLAQVDDLVESAAEDWSTFRRFIAAIVMGDDPAESALAGDRERFMNRPDLLALICLALQETGNESRSVKQQDLTYVVLNGQLPKAGEANVSDAALQLFSGSIFADEQDLEAIRSDLEAGRYGFRTQLHAAIAHEKMNGVVVYRQGRGMRVHLTENYYDDPDFPPGGLLRIFYHVTEREGERYTTPENSSRRYDDVFVDRQNVWINLFARRMNEQARDFSAARNLLDFQKTRQHYFAAIGILITYGALRFDLDLVSDSFAKQLQHQYGFHQMLEQARKARQFQRVASLLDDFEAYTRFLALEGAAALRSENHGMISRTLGSLKIASTDRRLQEHQESRAVLQALMQQLEAATSSTDSDNWFKTVQTPDRREWRLSDIGYVLEQRRSISRPRPLNKKLIEAFYDIDIDEPPAPNADNDPFWSFLQLPPEPSPDQTRVSPTPRPGRSILNFIVGGIETWRFDGPDGLWQERSALGRIRWCTNRLMAWSWILVSRLFVLFIAYSLWQG